MGLAINSHTLCLCVCVSMVCAYHRPEEVVKYPISLSGYSFEARCCLEPEGRILARPKSSKPSPTLCLCQSWNYRYFLTCCMDAVIQTLSLMITEQTFLTPEPSLSPLFFSLSLCVLVLCMFVYLDLSSIL